MAAEIVFAELSPKMRAVFAICYFTACRVSEALHLTAEDIQGGKISFRRVTTKTNHSREVSIAPGLATLLKDCELPTSGKLFGVSRQAADKALRKVCDLQGIKGVSTHSFRRTAATRLHRNNVPLRVIQKIGGWSSLQALQLYLEVTEKWWRRSGCSESIKLPTGSIFWCTECRASRWKFREYCMARNGIQSKAVGNHYSQTVRTIDEK